MQKSDRQSLPKLTRAKMATSSVKLGQRGIFATLDPKDCYV